MALYTHIKGPVKYTVVGSPTIVDGVVSGFSANDYLRANLELPEEVDAVEVQLKFKMPNSVDDFVGHNVCKLAGAVFQVFSKLLYIPQGSFSSTVACSYVMEYGSDVVVKLVSNKEKTDIYFKNNNGVWELNKTVQEPLRYSGTCVFGKNLTSDTIYWSTSIDLNHTYITVNGLPRFGSCPVRAKFRTGLAKYNIVGSPTVEDGILSGVIGDNRCIIPSFNPGEKDFEMMFKVDKRSNPNYLPIIGIGQWMSWTGLACGNNNINWYPDRISSSSAEPIYVAIDKSTFDWKSFLYAGKSFYIRASRKKNANLYVYKLEASIDKEIWVGESVESDKVSREGEIYLLNSIVGQNEGKTYLDLNETYIKINGEYFFRGAYNADTYTLRIK